MRPLTPLDTVVLFIPIDAVERPRPWPQIGYLIIRVDEAAFCQRKATAANAATQTAPQFLQSGDAGVQFTLPVLGQALPILLGGDAVIREFGKDPAHQGQRNACTLGCPDDSHTAQH